MASIFHLGLSKDFSLILDDADDYNVIIQVGENQNTKEFHAHSVILRARSLYFKRALSANWITKRDNMIIFNKPNLTPIVFDMILKYIYTGELDLTKQSGENILDLLVASDELLLEELFGYVQNYLFKKKIQWVLKNSVLVLNAVFGIDNCKKLQDYCFETFCKNPLLFFASEIAVPVSKEILLGFLKRDDLRTEEIIIWDYLIEWGIKQTPGLWNEDSDRAKWNNKDYKELKNTLNQLIPFIRFTGISHADFLDKVCPYKTIIPNHIYQEIEAFYYKDVLHKITILPPRIGFSIDSNIINPTLAKLIVNWIDKEDIMYIRTSDDPSYNLKLIYRGSCDGISNKSFIKRCKSRLASLVLIKVRNSSKVIGGYSSIGFCSLGDDFIVKNGSRFYTLSDNFIFSFEDSEDTQHMKISRVVNKSHAIMDSNFGWGSLSMNGYSLHVNNNSYNYENNLNTDTIYTIEEIETFVISNN